MVVFQRFVLHKNKNFNFLEFVCDHIFNFFNECLDLHSFSDLYLIHAEKFFGLHGKTETTIILICGFLYGFRSFVPQTSNLVTIVSFRVPTKI